MPDPQLAKRKNSMNKIVSSPQDSEMLDEYDFSQGTRGKYFSRYPNNNLPSLRGVRYLTDGQGRKTAVLLDWQEHRLNSRNHS